MRILGLSLALLALLAFVLPMTSAQEKKDADKAEKKDTDKDSEKDEKKSSAKAKVDEDKVEYGSTLKAKIVSMRGESAGEFSIEVPVPDTQKILQFQVWKQQQLIQIAQQQNPQARAQQTLRFQVEMARKQATEIYAMKVVDVKAVDGVKVRSLYPPSTFDDQGNPKKWTQKELIKLKGKSKLPGYPVDLDALKIGQTVQLFLPKSAAPTKTAGAEKRRPKIEDEPDPVVPTTQEVVMIIILQEPLPQP